MPLTSKESELREQKVAERELRAKSIGVPPALLRALEKSEPALSISQQTSVALSNTSQNFFKSLKNFIPQPSSSKPSWVHQHGVPTGLFRLPLEIREQIYGYVTGHGTILKIPEKYHQGRLDRSRRSARRSNTGPNSLLQTCRQIYSEAIPNIYTRSTFHFQDHNDFLAFAHDVNPVFLSQITSLTFDLNSVLLVGGTPYDHQCPRFTIYWTDDVKLQWSHLWAIIAAMENVVSIKVFLQDPGSPEWDGMQCLCVGEPEMLAPLRKVTRELKMFEVDVPWANTDDWSCFASRWKQPIAEGAPFTMTWRGIADIASLYRR